jgi:hypothetical protein
MTFDAAPPFKIVSSYLIFFRANAEGTYPASPLELGKSIKSMDTLVCADLETCVVSEYPVVDTNTLHCAIEHVFSNAKLWDAHVYTIHACSVLARLMRWHAIRTGRPAPQSMQPGFLKDLVEEINKPAILSGAWRYNFKLEDYRSLLDLKPDPRFDPEVGLLVDIIKRYVKN